MDTLDDARIRAVARTGVGGDKRIEILDAAIAVIVRRGFDNTRYVDIAEASGVAVSTLQYYFGSLESLLIETCLYASHRDLAVVRERVAALADPWDRLMYLVDVFITSESPGPGWQAQIEYWRAAFTRPHLREELIRDQNTWRALLADTIRDGIANGAFTTGRDPELIAMQVNCQLDGTVFPAFVGNPAYDSAAFRAAVIDDLADLLNYGARSTR
jgi:AcrR family transcriptional regulator